MLNQGFMDPIDTIDIKDNYVLLQTQKSYWHIIKKIV